MKGTAKAITATPTDVPPNQTPSLRPLTDVWRGGECRAGGHGPRSGRCEWAGRAWGRQRRASAEPDGRVDACTTAKRA
jgi:hypothetical protein